MFLLHSEPVLSFERVTLQLSGMREAHYYAIANKGSQSEVCEYEPRYEEEGEEQRMPIKCVSVDTETVLKILNDCHVIAWDDFHGRHPWGIKDGLMFHFTARVNDGREIRADGSQNFPRHFQELRNWVESMLKDK